MPDTLPPIVPYIPETITVHLGSPNADAQNVTVPFSDYIKNVVSGEVYPTWETSALRANALAIISYALNRVYTEYYRSRGYAFDITNSTAVDQKFIYGRNIYENVSELVDNIFNDYIRRQGFVEPLAAKYCNGTTSTCDGLSQWGSQYQALEGANSVEILRSYYGNDIELVVDAPIEDLRETYPGTPLLLGSVGPYVLLVQVALNRVSQNYPAIPKVEEDSIFTADTERAVIAFQTIFSLAADGIVGRATWYQLVQVYFATLRLTELRSEGQLYARSSYQFPGLLQEGDTGISVRLLQYMLNVAGEFLQELPQPPQTGVFDNDTRTAVLALQAYEGLDETGTVGEDTWDALLRQYTSIDATVFRSSALFPDNRNTDAVEAFSAQGGAQSGAAEAPAAQTPYQSSTRFAQFPGQTLTTGMRDEEV